MTQENRPLVSSCVLLYTYLLQRGSPRISAKITPLTRSSSVIPLEKRAACFFFSALLTIFLVSLLIGISFFLSRTSPSCVITASLPDSSTSLITTSLAWTGTSRSSSLSSRPGCQVGCFTACPVNFSINLVNPEIITLIITSSEIRSSIFNSFYSSSDL